MDTNTNAVNTNIDKDATVQKIVDSVKNAMRSMKGPITTIALRGTDEKAMKAAVDEISDILMDLARGAFGIGMKTGSDAVNHAWSTSLDNIQKRFFERISENKETPNEDKRA